MALMQITQKVLNRVEEISGRPMIVQADPAVPMAMAIMARGPAPAHLLKYNPSSEATVDYIVCFQAGFILRKFATQESERVDLQTSVRGQKEADSVFTQHFKKTGLTLPHPVRAQMYDGLIVQLRSMPIAMRVETWLRRDCPELIDQQKASNARQMNDNATCLLPQVRQLTPAKILHANVAMNAAFARFWSRMWDDPTLVVPYKSTGNLADGDALLKLLDETPDNPANDQRLIEAWGEYLHLGGWYDFVPNS